MTGTIPAVGTSLYDRYTIEREIGRGGMAVITISQRETYCAKKVAIKSSTELTPRL